MTHWLINRNFGIGNQWPQTPHFHILFTNMPTPLDFDTIRQRMWPIFGKSPNIKTIVSKDLARTSRYVRKEGAWSQQGHIHLTLGNIQVKMYEYMHSGRIFCQRDYTKGKGHLKPYSAGALLKKEGSPEASMQRILEAQIKEFHTNHIHVMSARMERRTLTLCLW